jgi:hypothetical protein
MAVELNRTIMSLLNVKRQSVAGEYNRAADPSGGVPGTIVTGVKIPKFALVCSFQLWVIQDLNTSAANTVSFGFSTTDSPLIIQDPIAYLGATALPLLIPPTVFANASLPILPVKAFNFQNLIMVIGGAGAITSGRIGFVLEYFELDN